MHRKENREEWDASSCESHAEVERSLTLIASVNLRSLPKCQQSKVCFYARNIAVASPPTYTKNHCNRLILWSCNLVFQGILRMPMSVESTNACTCVKLSRNSDGIELLAGLFFEEIGLVIDVHIKRCWCVAKCIQSKILPMLAFPDIMACVPYCDCWIIVLHCYLCAIPFHIWFAQCTHIYAISTQNVTSFSK